MFQTAAIGIMETSIRQMRLAGEREREIERERGERSRERGCRDKGAR